MGNQLVQAEPGQITVNQELAPAIPGRILKLKSVLISVSRRMTVTLANTGGKTLLSFYFGGNGGVALGAEELDGYQTLEGEGITYSTSKADSAFIKVAYEVV